MRRSYFSIAEVMLVIAVAAIFLSAGRMFWQDLETAGKIRELLILRGICGAVIGAVVGFGIGIPRRMRHVSGFLGIWGGAFIGVLAATIVSIPQNVTVALIGAAVLLAFGVVVRVFSKSVPESEYATAEPSVAETKEDRESAGAEDGPARGSLPSIMEAQEERESRE
jgi:hypothetical protein